MEQDHKNILKSDFPYIKTDVTEVFKSLKHWINERESILLLGPEGCGKSVILKNFFESEVDYNIVNGRISSDNVCIKEDKIRKDKINIILWDDLEGLNFFDDEKQEHLLIKCLKLFSQYSSNICCVQVFAMRTSNWKDHPRIPGVIANWLTNSVVSIHINYDILDISKQLIERKLLDSDDNKTFNFSGNFKIFQQAFDDNIKISKDEKMNILMRVVGDKFGPIFFNNRKEFESKPLSVRALVKETVPEIFSYDDQYWQAVRVLILKLKERNFNISDIEDTEDLKRSFVKLGLIPSVWLSNRFTVNVIADLSEKVFGNKWEDKVDFSTSCENFINQIMDKINFIQ